MHIENDVKRWKTTMTGQSVEAKSNLPQNHRLAKDTAFSPKVIRDLKPREEDKASKFYQHNVLAQHIDGRPLFSPEVSGYYPKSWPNELPLGAEELVKHMSDVPGYLQCTEKDGNPQEKALNFGVLGWQRLEKWTNNHSSVTNNEKVSISPASSNGSSTISSFGLSSKSSSSSSSKHAAFRNQSPLNFHQDSSAEEECSLTSEEASRYAMRYKSPETEWCKCPVRCHMSDSTEQCKHADNLVDRLEENERKFLDPQAHYHDVGNLSGASTLPSRSNSCAATHSTSEKLKSLEAGSDCKEECGEVHHKCYDTSLPPNVNFPHDHHSELSHLNDGTLGHSKESGSGHFSFESVESAYTTRTESGRSSFVGSFSYEEFQSSPANIPHLCPLISNVHRRGWSDVNDFVSEHGEESGGLCYLSKPRPQAGKLATVRSNGWHEKHDKAAIRPHKSFTMKTPETWSWNEVKRILMTGRELLHDNHSRAGLTGMIRSSRSGDSSARRQSKWTSSSDGFNEGKAADSSRARWSPLRRLLDPLLKPKTFTGTHTAKLAADSPRQLPRKSKLPMQEELPSTCELHSSTQVSAHSPGGNFVKGLISSRSMPVEKHGSVHNEKHESTKQTLLRLAWKNGLPLFTFSVNESDILVATSKKAMPRKEDCECIYTIYLVCETKKKSGNWINQGAKMKRKGLVSTVAGQMNVSCVRDRKNHFTVREFVLFGPELRPSVHQTLKPLPDNELAAIVVKVPEENVGSFISDLPQKNNCRDLSKRNPGSENNASKMVAILPGEVHGWSDTGKPSALVDRWRSEGLCDCGGWDVGCSLSILTDNLTDGESGLVPSCSTTDGTHRVELVIQGLSQESRPIFSLVVFKEELYTVDFHTSIAPLQAFAICIAILHCRKSTGLQQVQNLW